MLTPPGASTGLTDILDVDDAVVCDFESEPVVLALRVLVFVWVDDSLLVCVAVGVVVPAC
jgi:hypothetical protein